MFAVVSGTHLPLQAKLAVAGACLCALAVGLAPIAAAGEHEQVVDLTFPTDPRAGGDLDWEAGRGYTDDYDDARSSGAHQATDIMGEHGWPVYAAVGGTISFMPETEQSYGWMIRIQGDDDRRYSYVHLGKSGGSRDEAYVAGLSEGDRVERGEQVGYMGSSGNASSSAPHLHFAIRDETITDPYGDSYLNPYYSLLDAEERGDYADGDGADGTDGGDTSDSDGADATDGDAGEATSGGVDRVGGENRVATAVALSEEEFDAAHHVVLASGNSPADALAAGPLAAAVDGPVLTTRGDGLEQVVIDELARLDAAHVTVVGGEAAVPAQIDEELVSEAGLSSDKIQRVAGDDRYGTAAAVARKVWAGGDGDHGVALALGDHEQADRAWPDALTASYRGALTGEPVLLLEPDGVPQPTADALDDAGEAVVVGGTAAVPESVTAQVAERVDSVSRLAGPDRFATACAVVQELLDAGLVSPERVWAATGLRFPDALAAGPVVAHAGEVLVLVDGKAAKRDPHTDGWLRERADEIVDGRVVGGPEAVNEDALQRLADRIGSTE